MTGKLDSDVDVTIYPTQVVFLNYKITPTLVGFIISIINTTTNKVCVRHKLSVSFQSQYTVHIVYQRILATLWGTFLMGGGIILPLRRCEKEGLK